MRYFFKYVIDYDNSVRFFTIHHYLYIGAALLAFVIPYRYVYKESRWLDNKTWYLLFYGFIIFELYYHVQNFLYSSITLPLHLSSFSLILSLLLMRYPGNKNLFYLAFYIGVISGLIALFMPFSYGFPYYNFRYYHFLFTHVFIIFIPIYYYKKQSHTLSKNAFKRIFCLIVISIPIMYLVNYFLSILPFNFFHNYWFIYSIPDHVNMYISSYLMYILILLTGYYLAGTTLNLFCKKSENALINTHHT